jgi:hypothetical protein
VVRRPAIALPALATVATAAALAGCGGGSSTPRSEPPASAPASAAPAEPAVVACVPGGRRAVSRAAGAPARMRTTAVATGEATCIYRAGAVRADVHVDANPQAEVRFGRAVVERDQNAVWSSAPERAPRLIQGIGRGADWFPADRELLTTDGRRLISVKLVRAPRSGRARLRLARAVAGATLEGGS